MDNKSIKIYCLIIGSFGVGKTTLINRLNDKNQGSKSDYEITTRINITRKTYTETEINKRIEIVYVEFPGKQIYENLMFEFIIKIPTNRFFIAGMFDISNRQSLSVLENVLNSIQKIISTNTTTSNNNHNKAIESHRIMLANKIDLVDKRIIPNQEGQSKAKMLKCRYLECSTQNDLTMQMFEQSIIEIVKLNKDQYD